MAGSRLIGRSETPIELKKALSEFYGGEPLSSPHLARLINKTHFSKQSELLEDARQKEQLIYGGASHEQQQRIAPTLIKVSNCLSCSSRFNVFVNILNSMS